MNWFRRDRAEWDSKDAKAVPLTGIAKTDRAGAPPPAPPIDGPVLQHIAGDGHQVAPLTPDLGPVILHITYDGSGDFVVDALDGKLRSASQLVYAEGPFSCRSLINADDEKVRAVRVQADGPWSVDAVPVSTALGLHSQVRRPASDVLRYEGGPGIATLRHEGDPNTDDGGYFLVDTFEVDGSGFVDQLANHIGPWRGEAPLTGPCLIFVRSDGPWSIDVHTLEG
ncbi:hypothetical protein ACFRK5_11405 [Streptomyces niveus]|uniref:hypothetical protein n=1 Tax=Streptomyces niveus TaxID=193462 RepID=UPI0036818CDF